MRAASVRHLIAALAALSALACGAPDDAEPHAHEPTGTVSLAATSVDEHVNQSCSTTAVWGLSLQIVAQMNCIIPGALEEVPDRPNFSKGPATFPYMEPPAVDALVATLDAHPGETFSVNSMLRTVAQQYLLYRWGQLGRCGIGLAATPGNSNHESGIALDTSVYSTWRPRLESRGFKWFGSADAVHFDYVGQGAVDLRGNDVLAFQQLWNINNPGDLIAEDGDYGPQTAARLEQAPAEGFPLGADCSVVGSGGTGGTGGTGSGGTGGSAGASTGGTGGEPDAGVAGLGGMGGDANPMGGAPGLGGFGGTDWPNGTAGGSNAAQLDSNLNDSGCACSAVGGATPSSTAFWLGGLLFAATRRRRRPIG